MDKPGPAQKVTAKNSEQSSKASKDTLNLPPKPSKSKSANLIANPPKKDMSGRGKSMGIPARPTIHTIHRSRHKSRVHPAAKLPLDVRKEDIVVGLDAKTSKSSKLKQNKSDTKGSNRPDITPIYIDRSDAPTSFFGRCLACMERKYPMDPIFESRYGCAIFTRDVLGILGLKMILPTLCSIVLSHYDMIRNESTVASTVEDNFWIMFIALFLYVAFYTTLRIRRANETEQKHVLLKNLLYLILFTLCEICIVGVLTVILPIFIVVMISVTMTATCFTLAFHSWASERMEVRGPFLYALALLLVLLFSGEVAVCLCFVADKPESPVDGEAVGWGFLISSISCFVMISVILFELQKLMAGRRIGLPQKECTLAALIVPVSVLYPAFLLRKGQSIAFPSKILPMHSIGLNSSGDTTNAENENKTTKIKSPEPVPSKTKNIPENMA